MKISVVVPAYNEEKFLEACLKSLANQIEKPYEIIVVDNNSTDKTVEIAKKYHAKIVKEPNQGRTPARNAGFNLAKGDVIARTDADTRVPRDWTKKIRKAFEKDPELLGLSGTAYFDRIPNFLQFHTWLVTGSSKFIKLTMKHDGMMGFNLAVHKKAWEMVKNEICLDDRIVHEDADLAIHIARHGKVFFDDKIVVRTAPRQLEKIENIVEYAHRGVKTIRHHRKHKN